jgi:hypothetical protein
MFGIAGYHREAVFERRCGNREIEFLVADLRGQPPPTARDVDGEWQDTISESAQGEFKPSREIFGESRIGRLLTFNSSLDFGNGYGAQVKVDLRGRANPLCNARIAFALAHLGQNIGIEQVH